MRSQKVFSPYAPDLQCPVHCGSGARSLAPTLPKRSRCRIGSFPFPRAHGTTPTPGATPPGGRAGVKERASERASEHWGEGKRTLYRGSEMEGCTPPGVLASSYSRPRNRARTCGVSPRHGRADDARAGPHRFPVRIVDARGPPGWALPGSSRVTGRGKGGGRDGGG